MNGHSPSPNEQRVYALKSLIPEAFCEGKIDWEKLKAALGEDINFANERYVLNWAGKSDAFRILQQPSSSTLVPVREESVDFDNTQNIFIEGENLEVLKALQKSYFNKVKMIYIDPPYNTGNDSFIYPDKFSETKEQYLKRVGDKDESGYMLREGRFAKNSKENGQYHSNWLNMMMPRLYLAKNLLREDGVIFVSIDDNEVHNLRLLMNEIFGEENFRNSFAVRRRTKSLNLQFADNGLKTMNVGIEHVLVYSKSVDFLFSPIRMDKKEEQLRGSWNVFWSNADRPTMRYELLGFTPTTGQWRWSKEKAIEATKNYDDYLSETSGKESLESYWERTGKQKKFIRKIPDGVGKNGGVQYWVGPSSTSLRTSNWTDIEVSQIHKEFDLPFDNPKNVDLLKTLVSAVPECGIVLDFFSGSGTTAHAVMQLNREDGGNRKYICVQLPEKCDEKSEAFKAGYKTIADIAKERIRRAGTKIRGEVEAEQAKQSGELGLAGTPEVKMPDLGFKVFRLEDSNFKQWRKTTAATLSEVEQQMLDFVDPVKPGAAVENIVYELLLKSGKDLNCEIVRGNGFYKVNGGELVLLLESASQEIVDSVIALAPAKVIALDSLFHGNDQLKTNTSLQFRDSAIEFLTI